PEAPPAEPPAFAGASSGAPAAPAPETPPSAAKETPAAPIAPSAPATPAKETPAEPIAPAKETPAEPVVPPKETPAEPAAALSGDCRALYDEIRAADEAIPENLSALGAEEADRLARRVEDMVAAAKKFDSECRDAPVAAEVKFFRAKGLFLLSDRFRLRQVEALRASGVENVSPLVAERLKAYHGEVQDFLRSALEKLPADSPLRRRALVYLGMAASEGGDHESAFEAYQKYLEQHPDDQELDRILLALARECLELGRFDLGVDFAERVQKDYFDRESYVSAGELLWRLHHARGDLDQLWEQTQTVDTVYPLKLASASLSRQHRDRLRLYLSYNGFRKGYVLLARGDCEGAAKAFREHLAAVENSPDATSAEKVIAMRSRKNLDFAEKLCGKPAPRDLELLWTTAKTAKLAESRGKAVILVFRGVGDERSRGILAPLSELATSSPDIEVVAISYLFSGHEPDDRAQAMRDEIVQADYSGPAGFDPDSEGRSLFRAFLANVGSATLEVVAPDGTLRWIQEDPRPVDAGFVKALVQRLLSERTK
ncbi:MAG: tetratricopeptide repeat protein, partial [Planctomycetota bacterium]